MMGKETYIRKVEERVADWQHDIFKFKVIAEAEETELDHQMIEYRIIEDIVDRKKAVLAKLDQLKHSSTDDWYGLQQQIDTLSRQVSEAIHEARYVVN